MHSILDAVLHGDILLHTYIQHAKVVTLSRTLSFVLSCTVTYSCVDGISLKRSLPCHAYRPECCPTQSHTHSVHCTYVKSCPLSFILPSALSCMPSTQSLVASLAQCCVRLSWLLLPFLPVIVLLHSLSLGKMCLQCCWTFFDERIFCAGQGCVACCSLQCQAVHVILLHVHIGHIGLLYK